VITKAAAAQDWLAARAGGLTDSNWSGGNHELLGSAQAWSQQSFEVTRSSSRSDSLVEGHTQVAKP